MIKTAFTILMFLSCGWVQAQTTHSVQTRVLDPHKFSQETYKACSIFDSGFLCEIGPINIAPIDVLAPAQKPNLYSSAQVTCLYKGPQHLCWDFEGKISDSNSVKTFIGSLKNPQEIWIAKERPDFSNSRFDCAKGRSGLYCSNSPFDKDTLRRLKNVVQVAQGEDYVCALDLVEGVSCEALDNTDYTFPRAGFAADQITSGAKHMCVLANQKVDCFGNNEYGQLQVPRDLKHPTFITADYHSTCAIDGDRVRCWGSQATDAPAGFKNPRQALTFASHGGCAIDDDGLKCWTKDSPLLEFKTKLPQDFVSLRTTPTGVCLLSTNNLSCWTSTGSNWVESPAPKEANDLLKGYVTSVKRRSGGLIYEEANHIQMRWSSLEGAPTQFTAGVNHICILKNGYVDCFGSNEYGQLDVPKDLKNVSKISAGSFHTCAIAKGLVRCWGYNYNQQTSGDGVFTNATDIMSSKFASCATLSTGRSHCWGYFYSDQSDSVDAMGGLQLCRRRYDESVYCDFGYYRKYGKGQDVLQLRGKFSQIFARDLYVCGREDQNTWQCSGRTPFWTKREFYKESPIEDDYIQSAYRCQIESQGEFVLDCVRSDSELRYYTQKPILNAAWVELNKQRKEFFTKENLKNDLLEISKKMTPLQARLLAEMSGLLTKDSDNSNFVLKLIGPSVESFATPYFKRYIIPSYRKAALKTDGVVSEKLALTATRKILESLQDGKFSSLIKILKSAEKNPKKMNSAKAALEQNRSALNTYASSTRMKFVFETLEISAQGLGVSL